MEPEHSDVEELTLCTFCKQKFNTTDLCPKILQCKHYFCLKCIETTMVKGRELFCVHCWKRTEIGEGGAVLLQTHTPILSLISHLMALQSLQFADKDKGSLEGENCLTHGMPHTMWCLTCHKALCRACMLRGDHPNHQLKTQLDAKEMLVNDVQSELNAMSKVLLEIQRLSIHQREFLLRVLEACITLKACVESDLQLDCGGSELQAARETLVKTKASLLQLNSPSAAMHIHSSLSAEKHRLESKYHEMLLQCKLDDLISTSSMVFDFSLLTQALQNLQSHDWSFPRTSPSIQNPILFLTNYCMSQLYSRYVISKGQTGLDFLDKSDVLMPVKAKLSPPISLIRNPSVVHPTYYFDIDANQTYLGRILIETRPDLAPKMCKNFAALCSGETGPCYKACSVFQCWEGESIITGDYETNNGRGGRSIFEEGYFMPDETKIPSVRGAVGMRRTQKRHDNMGMVGSQFRVILQEMRGFTAIFGHVVEGIEVIERIAGCGDQTGKPTKAIVITQCGKL